LLVLSRLRLKASLLVKPDMLTLTALVLSQNLPLPPLRYDYNALEPHIDARTMEIHHLKHHQTYTDKLNAALATLRSDPAHKHLAKMGIDKLLGHLDEAPKALQNALRNHGGGYVNHGLFFDGMSPDGGGEPTQPALVEAIQTAFGSFASFKSYFALAALELFGSGWAWLVYDQATAAVKITTTANQDTPAMQPGLVALLGLDVWEHAYYLKHQNVRKNYVEDFWNIVSWEEVAKRYDAAVSRGKAQDKSEV